VNPRLLNRTHAPTLDPDWQPVSRPPGLRVGDEVVVDDAG
jgi:hypothetical protein